MKDVSFSVRRGEIFGIGGLVGAGRSELASLIFGSQQRDSGELLLDGKRLPVRSPREAIKSGICLITEDRKQFALFFDRAAQENVVIVKNEMERGPLLNHKEENLIMDGMIQQLQIVLANREQPVSTLSGGNQQKTVIARWLLNNCDVYIFDEPTKGVDVGARAEIYKLITNLAKEGKCVIMISSDMPELLSMSDRIGVMRDGTLTCVLPGKTSEEELLKCFLGVNET